MSNFTSERARVNDSLFSAKEKALGGVLLVATAASAVGIWQWSEAQQRDLRNSLSDQASEKILNFASLADGEGETPQTALGEVRNAVVTLTDGNTCSIQYKTHSEGWATFGVFDNRADLVSFGTCPPAENVG
jgi:hypothetical protein